MTGTPTDASGLGLPVRSTFLHRPPPPPGGLLRSELHAVLDRALERPASLVCAPAGFGKSVLISQWCEHVERPVAWLSLDSAIDHPHWFLMHLAASVRTVVPDALEVVTEMALGGQLPTQESVIAQLSNELDELPEPIVVVLDDFQQVKEPKVHHVVAELLRHPSPALHLVIISREEPPLPISTLRAHGHIVELRGPELAFSPDELETFLENELHRSLPSEQVRDLHDSTEGWPAGARLAVEGLRSGGDDLVGAGFLDQAAQEYLVAEVLERVPVEVRRHLVVASYFDAFDAAICDAAVATRSSGSWPRRMSGAEFIAWIRRHNLFVVQLDETGQWFRFHHLFARLLADWRASTDSDRDYSENEVRRAAADVLLDQGMAEEAIVQLHLAGADDELAVIAADHGGRLIEGGRWAELARMMSLIPTDTLHDDPDLLLLQACVVGENGSRYRELDAILDRVEVLLGRRNGDRATDRLLRGQVATLRALYSKFITSDFDGAIADARTAQRLLTDHPGRRLALAYVVEVNALACSGRSEEAHRLADSVVGDPRFADSPFDPMVLSRSYLGWLEGDLDSVERHATQLLSTDQRPILKDLDTLAHYFLGTCAYERNRLADAEYHLSITFARRYATKALYAAHAGMALAFTELALGRLEGADASAQATAQFVLDTQSEFLQPAADAFMAEFGLRRGRPSPGLHWARSVVLPEERFRFMWFNPTPALIEVLLSSPPDAPHGRELLDRALGSARQRNHRPLAIRLLGLRALDLAASGDDCGALDALESAVRMSQEGGIVRRLADLGPPLRPLLHRLEVTGDVLTHCGTILAAIDVHSDVDRPNAASDEFASVADGLALSERELEVLRLLAARYSNKEIGRELIISPATVKKHTVSLYSKLNVHGRREAVDKAHALGYVNA